MEKNDIKPSNQNQFHSRYRGDLQTEIFSVTWFVLDIPVQFFGVFFFFPLLKKDTETWLLTKPVYFLFRHFLLERVGDSKFCFLFYV